MDHVSSDQLPPNQTPSTSTVPAKLVPPFPLIRDGLRQGRVIPFLGAGASLGMRNHPDEKWTKDVANFLPRSNELAEHLATQTVFPSEESVDLTKVAQYYNVVVGRTPLQNELHSIFARDYPFTSLHTYLADVSAPLLIVTTNYDDLIERAYRAKGAAYDVVIHTSDLTFGDRLLWWPYGNNEPVEVLSKSLDIDLNSVTVIYKMHGAVDRYKPERDQYVITEDDYIDFLARMVKNKAIPAIFADAFQTRHFLFLGYSLRDWNLRVVLNRIEKDKRWRNKEIISWAIRDNPSPLERQFWGKRKVEVYDMRIEDFVERLKHT